MSVYEYTLVNAAGEVVPMAQFRGQVLIIVNVALLCGYTPQYRELQLLYEQYHDQGLEILAFPCDQFRNQEPFTAAQLQQVARVKFGATFPFFAKCHVNGAHELPLYTFLKGSRPGMLGFRGVRWNFEKFVVARDGRVVHRAVTDVPPLELEPLVRELLA